MSKHLRRLAERAASQPNFWAHALAKHRQLTGLTEQQQADRLHISADDLVHLALCFVPRPDHFAEDLEAVASRWNADPDALKAILDELGM